jgi:hypothetical protein
MIYIKCNEITQIVKAKNWVGTLSISQKIELQTKNDRSYLCKKIINNKLYSYHNLLIYI